MFKKFLSLPNHSIRVCFKGKIINCGVAYGLEIPVEYIFCGNEKAVQWAKRTLDAVDGNVKKSFKILKAKFILKKNQLFPPYVLFFLACPPLGGNFHKDNPNKTFCPLMRGVRYFCPLFRGFFIRDLYYFFPVFKLLSVI